MKNINFKGVVLLLIFFGGIGSTYAQEFKHDNRKHLNAPTPIMAADIMLTYQNGPMIYPHNVENSLWTDLASGPGNSIGHKKAKDVRAYVKLAIDHDNLSYHATAFAYKVFYKIKGFKIPGDLTTYDELLNEELTITYNPDNLNAYQDIQMKSYSGYHRLEMEIIDIVDISCLYGMGISPTTWCDLDPQTTTIPDPPGMLAPGSGFIGTNISQLPNMHQNWSIDIGIVTQEFINDVKVGSSWQSKYGANAVAPTIQHIAPVLPDNHLKIQWENGINGDVTPVMYELEWTYVDDYKVAFLTNSLVSNIPTSLDAADPNSLNYDFSTNSTRVLTDKLEYDIPLTYKRGYLIYRVRLVRPDENKFKDYIKGPWTNPNSIGTVGSLASTDYYWIDDNPHVGDQMNWNYQVSFAEEGKSKHVVSYFDGLLKNQQSVTKFSSLKDQSIVAQTLYNYNGQAAVQSLPIPVAEMALTYRPAFLGHAGGSYLRADYDNSTWSALPSLSNNITANKYYSDQNFLYGNLGWDYLKMLPDAEGYPLIHTAFDPVDGRVRAQGGAGPKLQLGTGRETKTYYVPPSQSELNKHFGLNIGKAPYYEKVITQDPNEQLSFSIMDNTGKVRMSGLMGFDNNPSSPLLLPDHVILPSINPSAHPKTDLLYGQSRIWSNGAKSIGFPKFQEIACSPILTHNISLTDFEACSGFHLNIPLHYKISILNEYGVEEHTDVSPVAGIGSFSKALSASAGLSYNSSNPTTNQLDIGLHSYNYKVYYKQQDIEAAVDDLLNPVSNPNATVNPLNQYPTCFKQESSFMQDALDKIEPCGELDEGSIKSECDVLDAIIINDISPGGNYGSYGLDADGTITNEVNTIVGEPISIFAICGWKYGDFPLSILTQANTVTTYLQPSVLITTDPTDISLVHQNWGPPLIGSGAQRKPVYRYQYFLKTKPMQEIVSPSLGKTVEDIMNMPINELINSWNDEIAAYFAPMHPEYCKRQRVFCDKTDIESVFENISSYSDAVAKDLHTLDKLTIADNDLKGDLQNATTSNNSFLGDYFLKHINVKEGVGYAHKRLDIMAFKSVFCGSDNVCISAADSWNEAALNTEVGNAPAWKQDLYMSTLLDFYLANRGIAKARYSQNNNTVPCSSHPNGIPYILERKFPRVYNSFGDDLPNTFINTLSTADQATINDALNNSTVAGFNNSLNTNYGPGNNPTAQLDDYADEIVRRLGNCITGSGAVFNDPQFRADLWAFMNTPTDPNYNANWKGGLTPNALENLLTSGTDSYSIDDLCNPYLIDYLSEPTLLSSSNCPDWLATNNSSSMGDLLNRSDIIDGFKTSFAQYSSPNPLPYFINNSFPLNPQSILEKKILEALFGNTTANTVKAEFIYNSAGEEYFMIKLFPSSANYYSKFVSLKLKMTAPVPSSVNLDYWDYTSQPVDLPLVSRTGCAEYYFDGVAANFKVEFGINPNDAYTPLVFMDASIIGLESNETNVQETCITCKELKENYVGSSGFSSIIMNSNLSSSINIKGYDHPYWEQVVKSYFNFKFNKKHAADRYLKFMESCNLTNDNVIPSYSSYLSITNAVPFALPFSSNVAVNAANLSSQSVPTNALLDEISQTATSYISKEYLKDIKFTHFVEFDDPQQLYINSKITFDLTSIPKEKIRDFIKVIEFFNANNPSTIIISQNELDYDPTDNLKNEHIADVYVYHIPNAPSINTFTTNQSASANTPISSMNWIPDYSLVNQPQNLGYTTNFNHQITDGVILDNGTAHQVKKYEFKHASPVTNPAELSVATYKFNTQVLNSIHNPYQGFQSGISHLNKDNLNNFKKAYLEYNYDPSLALLTKKQLMDKLTPQALIANVVPPYSADYSLFSQSGKYLSYYNIDQKGPSENLYLKTNGGNTTGAGFTFLNGVLNHVKTDYAQNTNFPPANLATIANYNNQGTWSIKQAYQANNIYWIYLRDNLSYRNIYLRLPEHLKSTDFENYKITSINIAPTAEHVRKFEAVIEHKVTPNLKYTIDGKTDFDLTNTPITVFETVMLCEEPEVDSISTCVESSFAGLQNNVQNEFDTYKEKLRTDLISSFSKHIEDNVQDKLEIQNPQSQYITTLYGYDRAGNLIYTVPPAGVDNIDDADMQYADAYRDQADVNVSAPSTLQIAAATPDHKKQTNYYYDSRNQLIAQNTPDGGGTEFYYDKAGRLIFSQNAKQKPNKYSYTLYDQQNRIIETGEVWKTGLVNTINDLKTHQFTISHEVIKNTVLGLTRREVTHTFYDEEIKDLHSTAGLERQGNLRSRVAAIASYKALASNVPAALNFIIAQHYNYDISGNVKTLVYDMPKLEPYMQRYKRIDYDYDLYSGKVTLVSYNRSYADQYYQRYLYDDDNRITEVHTSKDGLLWDNDAVYTYYPHGPLARLGLGDLRVQGIDFVYTLQGWLKSINGDGNTITDDPGQDGNTNSVYSQDLAKSTLHYYNGDYKSIDPAVTLSLPDVGTAPSLFNGNIAALTSIPGNFPALRSNYTYDQLNRIKGTTYNVVDYTQTGPSRIVSDFTTFGGAASTNASGPTVIPNDLYKTAFSYDMDGNIETLKRHGLMALNKMDYSLGTTVYLMDDLNYTYDNTNIDNKLLGYSDVANRGTLTDPVQNGYEGFDKDLPYDPDATQQLHYDAIGNLINDYKNNITDIHWSLYGKLTDLTMPGNKHMQFAYDPSNNRWSKSTISYPEMKRRSQYYIRDASGNILAIYKHVQNLAVLSPMQEIVNGLSPVSTFPSDLYTSMMNSSTYEINLIDKTLELNANFSTTKIASKNVGYYMSNNAPIYNAMIRNTPDLITDLQTFAATSVSDMFVTGSVNSALLEPLVYEQDESIKTQHIEAVIGENDLTIMTNIMLELGSEEPVEDRTMFISSFLQHAQSSPQDAILALSNHIPYNNFTTALPNWLIDNSYISTQNSDMTLGGTDLFLREELIKNGNQTTLINFYNQASNGHDVLNNVASSTAQLATIYNIEGANLHQEIANLINGKQILAESLEGTEGLTPMKVLNGLINVSPTQASYQQFNIGTTATADKIYLAEHHIYGSSRLGTKEYWPTQYLYEYDQDKDIAANALALQNSAFNYRRPWYSQVYNTLIDAQEVSPYNHTHEQSVIASRILGQKKYEITNHLGNVMTVVTDKKEDVATTVGPDAKFQKPTLYSAYDYYPFGMLMPDRYIENSFDQCTYVSKNVYKKVPINLWTLNFANPSDANTFNPMLATNIEFVPISPEGEPGVANIQGQEPDNLAGVTVSLSGGNITANKEVEVEFDIVNLGENIVQIDLEQYNPLTSLYETITESSYTLEPDRDERFTVISTTINNQPLRAVLKSEGEGINAMAVKAILYTYIDELVESKLVRICNTGEFDNDYRFGFNGQEKDNEVKGIGNSLAFKFRVYDSRLGKFLSIDPLTPKYPMLTPYQFASNTPIRAIDIDGLEGVVIDKFNDANGDTKSIVVTEYDTEFMSEHTMMQIHNNAGEIVGAYMVLTPIISANPDNSGTISASNQPKPEGSGAIQVFDDPFSQGVSAVLDEIPLMNWVKGMVEFGAGKDMITNEPLGWSDRVMGAIPTGKYFQSGKKVVNGVQSGFGQLGKRKKNKLPDVGGPSNGTLTNKPGTTIKKYDKDGNVTKEFNKGHKDHSPTSKNYDDHVHDYKVPGSKRDRMPARTPKRNEKLKDFNE